MGAGAPPENVVIIGSGPAGYTAAIYCGRANLRPLLFEGLAEAGGQLMATTDVENFPGFPDGILGPDLMANMRKQAARWGAVIESEDVTSVDLGRRPFVIKSSNGRTVETNSIIVATGATAKRLNLPGEAQYWSRGITACAVCDGAAPLFRDEPLAVVGGGDSAVEEAVYLTKYSPEVHLLVRSDKLRASKAMQDRALSNPKIKTHFNTVVLDVFGDDADKPFTKSPVRGIKVKTGEEVKQLPVRGLFYAIGHRPNTEIFKEWVNTDGVGYLSVKPGTVQTSREGVFAAGDVHDPHWRQAITAAGSGCMAALSAERYLSEKGLVREVRAPVAEHTPAKPSAPAPQPVVTGYASGDEDFDTDSTYYSGEFAFRKLQGASHKPIMVMFMSKTCGPCRILKPIISRVLKEYEGRVHFVEVDIEEAPELTLNSGIAGTPTVQIYQREEMAKVLRGVHKGSEYRKELDQAILESA